LLWGNANHNYSEATMGWLGESNFSWVSHKTRGWSDPHLVGYMESHDEQRLLYKNYLYGASAAGYSTKDTTIALERMALAANFFFTIPGPKMIWQFGEYGYDVDIDFNGRTGPKPIRWFYLDDWRREYVFNVYAALIDLKKEHDVFRTNDFTLNLAGAGKSIILKHPDMNVMVVGNFGTTSTNVTLNWPSLGTWHEFYTQSELAVPDNNVIIALEPGEYRLYSTVKIEKPEWLNTSIDEIISKPKGTFNAYPNPSKGKLSFNLNLESQQQVTIMVFDVFGKMIAEINQTVSGGNQTIEWNGGSNLNPGIYFARMISGESQETVKLIME
jgi:hypothetical protein